MSVTIVIPTTGADTLFTAVTSVLEQKYDTNCLVVVDGPEYSNAVHDQVFPYDDHPKLKYLYLPENVGANGFYGHRVYAAIGHLVNTDYVGFLDQDNWLDPEHVTYLRNAIDRKGLDWAYSYRKIVDKDGDFICEDNCESLGKVTGFVDTNCYLLHRKVLINVGHAWHGGWGADRVFYKCASDYFPNFDASGFHTVNYRLGGNEGSVKAEFFIEGNKRRA